MKNILIGIDFHKNTERILEQAMELAFKFKSKIWLVHVAAPDPDFVGYEPGPQSERDNRAEELKDEHQKLLKIAESIREKGPEAESLLIQGATVDTLLEQAEKLDIDLIVLGRHEHSFFYNLFFVNVPLEVMRKTDIPILVVPV